jgi:O-antigen ligase
MSALLLALDRHHAVHKRPLFAAGFLLIIGFALGGGGSDYGLNETAIKLAAIVAIALVLARPTPIQPNAAASQAALLFGLAFLIPLAQLIPLPDSIWRILPGRALAGDVLDGIGVVRHSHPLSLDPQATWQSMTALLPGLAILLAVSRIGTSGRILLARLVVQLAMLSLIVGLAQLASNGAIGDFYLTAHRGYPIGLFANRNHQADFLLVAIVLTGIALSPSSDRRRNMAQWGQLCVVLALSAGVIATTSRMGLVLLPFAVGAALPNVWAGRQRILGLMGLCGVGAAILLLAGHNGVLGKVIDRLATGNVDRLGFWSDTLRAIRVFWPAGSGMGTFVPVFQTVEPLEHLSPYFVNHAHNDYLEAVLEGGAPAAILLVASLAWWMRAAVTLRALPVRQRGPAAAGLLGLLIIGLHSLADYPVRILSIQLVAGMLVGFAAAGPAGDDGARRDPLDDDLFDRLDRASRGGRQRHRRGRDGGQADRDVSISDAHDRAIGHSINAELPIGTPGIVVTERHARIDDADPVAPDTQMALHRIGHDLPGPLDPLAERNRRGPADHGLGRLRGETFSHGMGDDALNAAIDLHLDDRRKVDLLGFGRIVHLSDNNGQGRGASRRDILEIGNRRRAPKREGGPADQFGSFKRAPTLPIISDLIAGPHGVYDA